MLSSTAGTEAAAAAPPGGLGAGGWPDWGSPPQLQAAPGPSSNSELVSNSTGLSSGGAGQGGEGSRSGQGAGDGLGGSEGAGGSSAHHQQQGSACNRLYSPSLDFYLELQIDGNLVLYREEHSSEGNNNAHANQQLQLPASSAVRVWGTNLSEGFSGVIWTPLSFALDLEGTWHVEALYGSLYYTTGSWSVGVSYSANAGYMNAPYRLLVGDDGVVRLVNKDGGEAWVSQDSREATRPGRGAQG